MTKNENVNKMHAQILNLRSAGIACAKAMHDFPPCGRAGGCHLQCPEARAAMHEIYQSMNGLLLLARMALDTLLHPNAGPWDYLCSIANDSKALAEFATELSESLYSDQDEFIRSLGETDSYMLDQIGTTFSKEEWQTLAPCDAWQNGQRLPQITNILISIEDGIAQYLDLFDSVLYSELLEGCNLYLCAEKKKAAMA
jgi:hypothetical protein